MGFKIAVESPKKIRPIMAARIIELAMITSPSKEIQIFEEAVLAKSGLPEEPMYWMPAIIKLIKVQAAPTKMATFTKLLSKKIKPEAS